MTCTRLMPLLLSLAILVAGCASTGDSGRHARPDWVDGSSARYPRAQYLIGRGQSDQLAAAQDHARADIAKIFEVSIHARSSDSQQLKQSSDESGSRSSLDTRIMRQISTETEQIIAGIEIADVWHNPETQDYYALAVLSRRPATARLRQQIDALDKATQKYISSSRNSDDHLTQAGLAARALDAQTQRAMFQKMATIVDVSGRGVPPRWEPARLETDLNTLLGRIHIQPLSAKTGESGEFLVPLLKGALAAAGVTPGTANDSDYLLTGRLDITDLGTHDGWQWQRAALEITLSNKDSGQVRGQRSWINLKAAGLDNATAQRRLIDKVEQTLNNELRQTLLEMAAPG